MKAWLPHRLPVIPGWDVSGQVAAIGSEITNFRINDAVYGMLDFVRDGAYAEYVVAQARDLARKPISVGHEHAAAVPIAALTAWQALFEVAGLTAGESILIHGAAGGVGHFAIQLAKWKGARVIGTATGRHVHFVQELGADEVIDYMAGGFEAKVAGVDVVLDTIGSDTQQRSWKVLKKGGILVSTVGISFPQAAASEGVRGEPVGVHPNPIQLARIAALIDDKKLHPVIQSVLPLAEAAEAQRLSQAGHVRGKVVLKVTD